MSKTYPSQPTKRTLIKAAAALGAGTVAGITACRNEAGPAAKTHSPSGYPCYGPRQAGITTPHQQFGITTAFDITAPNAKSLENMLRIITARIEFLTQGGELQDPDPKLPPQGSGILGKTIRPDGLTVTVSVGASLFDHRFGLAGKKPKHLTAMPDFPNDKLQAEWCDGDLCLQFCAFSPETCQNALRDIIKHITPYAVVRWTIDGFLPKAEPQAAAARNLLGFRDGTANPDVTQPETADQVLWTGIAANSLDEPAWTKNGSYQVVRLIRHLVEFWDRTPLQEQEAVFGRKKYSGAPLGMQKERDTPDYSKDPEGKTIPKDSHMRLSNPRDPEFMKRHRIFRRPFNYSRGITKSGQLDVGLIFICYQANLADGFVFVQNLLNFEPLEEYIIPFGGGYFFTLPGAEKGGFFGQGLILA